MLMAVTQTTAITNKDDQETNSSFDLAIQLKIAFKAALRNPRLLEDLNSVQLPCSLATPFFPGDGGLTHIKNAMAKSPELDFNHVASHPLFTTLETMLQNRGFQITNAHKPGKGVDVFLTIEKM